jgi:hypothetical protein
MDPVMEFIVGDTVKRSELRPFEVDFLVPKVRSAAGRVKRAWTENSAERYEVLWVWPNGETSLAHYTADEIEKVV